MMSSLCIYFGETLRADMYVNTIYKFDIANNLISAQVDGQIAANLFE